MWSGKKSQPAIRTLIGEGTRFKGELQFSDGLRIDGDVLGDVLAAGDKPSILVISEKARVHGKVRAAHVIINGEVCGPVECTQLLELQPKARVIGDISYDTLEMHQGAMIDGELRPLKAAQDKPALTLAASNDA